MTQVITAGIDAGTSAIKVCILESDAGKDARILSTTCERIRRRDPRAVVKHAYDEALLSAGIRLRPYDVAYVASTGDGDVVEERTGHFFGMTTHARGASFMCPEATGALDVGALHARAIRVGAGSRVLGYRMTSQCASGTGQFVENIARYLGTTLSEVGPSSMTSTTPAKVSGICAVLAETDVINMVSRGVPVPDILRGIHVSMADRLVKLLRSAKIEGTVVVTGGLAEDVGLRSELEQQLDTQGDLRVRLVANGMSMYAGAIGAALWGAVRHARLASSSATATSGVSAWPM
ncbi:MAG: benzoyl-CoA reductase subunit D [Deltaproteobacteria bacterium]|nr:benzoyl-CoA reductase subunit D [Deltaproteobacteria bacterium]